MAQYRLTVYGNGAFRNGTIYIRDDVHILRALEDAGYDVPYSRADRHSFHPDHDSGEMNEAFEMECPAFIAGGETAEVLEAIKTPLDTVSMFVSDLIVRDSNLARAA